MRNATSFDARVALNGSVALYVKDLTTGDLSLVSTNAAGEVIRGGLSNPSMSADATRIAFDASSTNAHPADADSVADVFVKDVVTGHVFLASTASTGVKGNGPSYTVFLAVGGSTVAFRSDAANLDPADTDSVPDIYAKELGDAPQAPGDRADLAVAQTDSPDAVLAGQRLTYDIRIRNDGPATATGLTVAGGAGRLGAARVRHRESRFVRTSRGRRALRRRHAPGGRDRDRHGAGHPDSAGHDRGSRRGAGVEPDADTSDNAARVLTRVDPAADLSITLADTPDPVRVRERLTYRAEAANAGPSTAGTVALSVDLPHAVRVVSISAPGAFCPGSSPEVSCSFFGVEPGQRVAVTIAVIPKRTGALTASAAVSSPDTADPAPGNNADSEATTVIR